MVESSRHFAYVDFQQLAVTFHCLLVGSNLAIALLGVLLVTPQVYNAVFVCWRAKAQQLESTVQHLFREVTHP
jgi:hypothetical protein